MRLEKISMAINMKNALKSCCHISVIIAMVFVFSPNSYGTEDGSALFEKVLNKYNSLESYKDSGEQHTYYYENDKIKYEDKRQFQTNYLKRGKIRLEWIDRKHGLTPKFNILWKNKNGINILLWKKEVEKFDDLNSALSSVMGITAGISYAIPKYLSPNVPCEPLDGALSVLVKDDNATQTILEITYPSNRTKMFWIDKNSLLIRKIEWWEELSSYKVKEVIKYNDIVINKMIDEKTFDVDIKDFVIKN